MLNRRAVVTDGIVAAVLPGLAMARLKAGRPRFRRKVISRHFHNPATIFTNQGMKLKPRPYPSRITVGGFPEGSIREVQVTLHGFTHEVPVSVSLLLVAPTGRRTLLFANVGAGDPVTDLTLVLSAKAATPLPATVPPAWTSGTYQPANHGGPQTFRGPTVDQPISRADLTVFNGSDPRGVWRLYVEDFNWFHGFGEITHGWSLRITGTVRTRIRGQRASQQVAAGRR